VLTIVKNCLLVCDRTCTPTQAPRRFVDRDSDTALGQRDGGGHTSIAATDDSNVEVAARDLALAQKA
jgi:hypothetical protein